MRRAAALAALGTASAVALGALAASLADAAPGTRLAAAVTAPADDGPATSATGEYATVGGTVFATCGSGVLEVGTAPAGGWLLDDPPGDDDGGDRPRD